MNPDPEMWRPKTILPHNPKANTEKSSALVAHFPLHNAKFFGNSL